MWYRIDRRCSRSARRTRDSSAAPAKAKNGQSCTITLKSEPSSESLRAQFHGPMRFHSYSNRRAHSLPDQVQRVCSACAPKVDAIGPGEPGSIARRRPVPGPEIRVRQGERVRVEVENGLAEKTTVHWHRVRVPHAMDGVPHLTQKPIGAGERFVYEFDAVDVGICWYHPHQRSFEQVGRGLYGPLIIEEPKAVRADREVTWMLGD